MEHFCPGRPASFQPGSMFESRDTGTDQTGTFSRSMQRDRVTHSAKCSSSQSIIRELFRGKGERADYWKKSKETQSVVPPTRDREWRNRFTKNTPLRVKLKLNISAVKRKQANTMQWHQFPGVPGILLTTQSWGPARDACMHSHPL